MSSPVPRRILVEDEVESSLRPPRRDDAARIVESNQRRYQQEEEEEKQEETTTTTTTTGAPVEVMAESGLCQQDVASVMTESAWESKSAGKNGRNQEIPSVKSREGAVPPAGDDAVQASSTTSTESSKQQLGESFPQLLTNETAAPSSSAATTASPQTFREKRTLLSHSAASESVMRPAVLEAPGAFHFGQSRNCGTATTADVNLLDEEVGTSTCNSNKPPGGIKHSDGSFRNNGLPIAAELAPEDDEKLTRRMEAAMQERLQREVDARLQQERELHVVAEAVQIDESKHTEDAGSKLQNSRRRMQFLMCGLVVLLAIVVGVVVGVIISKNSTNDTPPTQAPTMGSTIETTEKYKLMVAALGDLVSSDPTIFFQSKDTPQYAAMDWLANQDTWTSANFDKVSTNTMVERYAAAVFYYSTGGENWKEQYSFLSPDSVCTWNAQGEELFGFNCGALGFGFIDQLWLGKCGMSYANFCYSSLSQHIFYSLL
jgi:hypothetical protein